MGDKSPAPALPNAAPSIETFVADLLVDAQQLIPQDGVLEMMRLAEAEGRQLRVKMGFDPTSPDLHLGHAVAMKQLKSFQDMGHLPVIIIGDFTGRIGDPSGRDASRPMVPKETLVANAATYLEQLGKVIDMSRAEVHWNSEWFEDMKAWDLVQILALGSLARIISRDNFRQRLDKGDWVGLDEAAYSYLQAHDSVAVDADIEIGGVDQLYAFQAARDLQSKLGRQPEALVLMPLLRGTDGVKKMSKSFGNYVGLNDEPHDMYGKIMSIPDSLIQEYLRLASTFSRAEIAALWADAQAGGPRAMAVKRQLAHNITTTYHDTAAADSAADHFDRNVRGRGEVDYRVVTVAAGVTSLVDVLRAAGIAASGNQARQLIKSGAVTVEGVKVMPDQIEALPLNGLRLRVGKRAGNQIEVKVGEPEPASKRAARKRLPRQSGPSSQS